MTYPTAARLRELRSVRAEDPEDDERGNTFHYLFAGCGARKDLLQLLVDDLEKHAGQAFARGQDTVANVLRGLLETYRTRLSNEEQERAVFDDLLRVCHTEEHWADECPGDHGK